LASGPELPAAQSRAGQAGCVRQSGTCPFAKKCEHGYNAGSTVPELELEIVRRLMRKRLIVLFAILFLWTTLACSVSQLAPRREARATATPSRTLIPTFTATATPTSTLTPSPTPLPTNTATPTLPPTDTPLPTDTPPPTLTPTETLTPLPTDTPTETPRPTARPRPKPTKTPVPKPTNTPPPPFNGTIVRGYPHCGGYAGVTGQVVHANDAPYPGVAVGVWSNTWQGRVGVSEADGKYEVPLSDLPPGHYQVAVVKVDTCKVQNGQPTAVDCRRLSNVITGVTVTEFCDVNRVTEIEFRGP
jgi:hypothetical protein